MFIESNDINKDSTLSQAPQWVILCRQSFYTIEGRYVFYLGGGGGLAGGFCLF